MESGYAQEDRDLLRLAEAARLISVHPDTLRRWTDAGLVTCKKTPGGHRRYRAEDVLAAMDGAA